MSEKTSLRDWLGFKGADDAAPNSVDRIRELESQIADLRSRRDITSLTQEEFEILATETAMTMIKSAQLREAKAKSLSERILNESTRQAKATVEDADLKAKSLQSAAESRGRKYIQDAESQAASLVASSKLQAAQIVEAAQRDGQHLISEATREVGEYRKWLAGVVTETERYHQIQVQSLATAETAIQQSRSQLESAFSRLSELNKDVIGDLNPDDSVVRRALIQTSAETVGELHEEPAGANISVLSDESARRVVKRIADSSK